MIDWEAENLLMKGHHLLISCKDITFLISKNLHRMRK